jgi:DNA-binding MarR family transcriptional regulator
MESISQKWLAPREPKVQSKQPKDNTMKTETILSFLAATMRSTGSDNFCYLSEVELKFLAEVYENRGCTLEDIVHATHLRYSDIVRAAARLTDGKLHDGTILSEGGLFFVKRYTDPSDPWLCRFDVLTDAFDAIGPMTFFEVFGTLRRDLDTRPELDAV